MQKHELSISIIDRAIRKANTSQHLSFEEQRTVMSALSFGYLVVINEQLTYSEEGLDLAKQELLTESQKDGIVKFATEHVIELVSLKQVSLSTQLRRITGDTFNTTDFVNQHNDDLTAEAGKIIVHIKTGLKFLIPA